MQNFGTLLLILLAKTTQQPENFIRSIFQTKFLDIQKNFLANLKIYTNQEPALVFAAAQAAISNADSDVATKAFSIFGLLWDIQQYHEQAKKILIDDTLKNPDSDVEQQQNAVFWPT
jgi:hypothetical protein